MLLITRVLWLSLATLVVSRPHFKRWVIHESLPDIPEGFEFKRNLAPDSNITLHVALAQSNITGLERILYDISNISSPNYGNYLSKSEVEDFVKPTAQTTTLIKAWLHANSLFAPAYSPAGDLLSITLSHSLAKKMFKSNFAVFSQTETGQLLVRTLSYSIPLELRGHIQFVHPTTSFDITQTSFSTIAQRLAEDEPILAKAGTGPCANAMTPACLQMMYNIPKDLATSSSANITVTGYIDQDANFADLQLFLKKYRPDMSQNTSFGVDMINAGNNNQDEIGGIEGNLDIQYAVGVSSGAPITFLSVGNENTDGALYGFLDTANHLLSFDQVPLVMSTSYVGYEQAVSPTLAANLCNAYLQLGARGTTVLFASGDGGVGGLANVSCSTFQPSFPSGCPFVTSVGATTGWAPEIGASLSSGGFSNYFPTPIYQTEAVAGYLTALGDTYMGLYNASGRGFPDISLQGLNFQVILNGSSVSIDGTSCATPTLASMIALLDGELMAAGKPTLGFINPLLYSDVAKPALNDVTIGANPGCSSQGFPAKPGWDPVTGLGSLDYARLKTAVGL